MAPVAKRKAEATKSTAKRARKGSLPAAQRKEGQKHLPARPRECIEKNPVKHKRDVETAAKSDSDSESEVEWEDVEEAEGVAGENLQVDQEKPREQKDVEISIEMPHKKSRREKQKECLMKYVQKMMRKVKKETQENMHKTHLLCLLSNGFHRNALCNEPLFKSIGLSLIPVEFFKLAVRFWDVQQLTKFVIWFKKNSSTLLQVRTGERMIDKALQDSCYTEAFVALCRAFGFLIRLVLSFQTLSHKVKEDSKKSEGTSKTPSKKTPSKNKATPSLMAHSRSVAQNYPTSSKNKMVIQSGGEAESSGVHEQEKPGPSKMTKSKKIEQKTKSSDKKEKKPDTATTSKNSTSKSKQKDKQLTDTKCNEEGKTHVKKTSRTKTQTAEKNIKKEKETSEGTDRAGENFATPTKSMSLSKKLKTKMDLSSSVEKEKKPVKNESSSDKREKKKVLRKRRKKVNYEEEGDSDDDSEGSEEEVLSPARKLARMKSTKEPADKSKAEKQVASKPKGGKKQSSKAPVKTQKKKKVESPEVISSDSEENFDTSMKFASPGRGKSSGASGSQSSPVSILSSDSSDAFDGPSSPPLVRNEKPGADSWVEVFLPYLDRWICVEFSSFSVNHPEVCEKHATQPLLYVLSYDNDNNVKDVTPRYASCWMTKTYKQRIDQDWWNGSLRPYQRQDMEMDEKENALLEVHHLQKPLPLSVAEFKNHPLYVLKRHLLKYEGIYPESAAVLGFCKGEPVYSRDCVHGLHTRETWMKEARVVKQGESAYKVVKGRPKRNQVVVDKNSITVDLFGEWQTEPYKPPAAKDGKVPRNEYGNVEMFKPCMLPPGTCHIQLPGIQRVARKLDVDCAPAVVGFDFHGGFTHPVIDGVVVCEEYKHVLIDAYEEEQREIKRKKAEKREKRALGNWKLLVKGLLIKERLTKKFLNEEKQVEEPTSASADVTSSDDIATDISVSWPLNVQEGKTSLAEEGHCHVFLRSNYKKDDITGEWTKSCTCGHSEPADPDTFMTAEPVQA